MSNLKFTIITPTYNRPDLLERGVKSLLAQNYKNWEMIIVNDTRDTDYSSFTKYLESLNAEEKNKIKYFKNEKNMGVNFTRDFAIKNISSDTDYIIFLDDDDYFSDNALEEINNELKINKKINWLITNRVKESGESFTKIKLKNKNTFSYFLDYLILKNISGDATHIINTDLIIDKKKNNKLKIKFSEKIKNGEEWFFFIQIPSKMIYKNLNSTISGGYLEGGVTDLIKNKYKENTKILWGEILKNKNVIFNFKNYLNIKILFYMILRSLRSLVK